MKKSAIWILLTVTLVFVAFIGGVYAGRNFHHTDIQISGGTTAATLGHSDPAPSHSSHSNTVTPPLDTKASTAGTEVPTATSSVPVFPININTATAEELDMLPEIGPILAQRIVSYRREFGPFTCVEDLLNVNGIGEKTLAKIREYITV